MQVLFLCNSGLSIFESDFGFEIQLEFDVFSHK